jgi:hypothetical protein
MPQLVVAVEAQRELELLVGVGEAVESLEEVFVVGHGDRPEPTAS